MSRANRRSVWVESRFKNGAGMHLAVIPVPDSPAPGELLHARGRVADNPGMDIWRRVPARTTAFGVGAAAIFGAASGILPIWLVGPILLGTIFVADGYGNNWIHKYDRERKYMMSFGGPGGMPAEDGKFNRCHGLAVDTRGPKPMLIVCNRESGRVEQWDTDGNLVKVLQRGLRMPAAANVSGSYVAIAELQGRVTILGKDNSIVAQIGDNPNTAQRANFGLDPAQWTDGICNSPHGVVMDRAGNVIVSEWSQFGRVLKFAVKK